MTSHNFRSYSMAVALYKSAKSIQLPYSLRDQLLRAASSVALNLREGSAKPHPKDRRRFYLIAFASLESEADNLAACLYRLTRS